MATGKTDWPMQVFYDGACPLCTREMAAFKRRDVKGRMEFVDISRADFDAAGYGLDAGRVQAVMHVRMADGRVLTEVPAIEKIWRALPWGFLSGFLRVLLWFPGVRFLSGFFYRWFARNRYKLTGRCTAESCSIDGKVR
jgi:predicted DCC family thiol-disulfide oxidoreductase YuxK